MPSFKWILAGLAFSTSAAYGADIELTVVQAELGRHATKGHELVNILIDEASQQALKAFTASRVGQTVHISVNGLELAAPMLRGPVDGRAMQMSLDKKRPDLPPGQEIVEQIKASKTLRISDAKANF